MEFGERNESDLCHHLKANSNLTLSQKEQTQRKTDSLDSILVSSAWALPQPLTALKHTHTHSDDGPDPNKYSNEAEVIQLYWRHKSTDIWISGEEVPLGHDEVAVDRSSQSDVDAADGVDVPEDQQHGPRHGLQHLHDLIKAVHGHVTHVWRLLSRQVVPQTQIPHVDRPLQQHLTEEKVFWDRPTRW